jgi:hypothetical protein
MRLTEHDAANVTLAAIAKQPTNFEKAKEIAVTIIEILAYRDAKWIDYIKEKYGHEVDSTELMKDYSEAKTRIKQY